MFSENSSKQSSLIVSNAHNGYVVMDNEDIVNFFSSRYNFPSVDSEFRLSHRVVQNVARISYPRGCASTCIVARC